MAGPTDPRAALMAAMMGRGLPTDDQNLESYAQSLSPAPSQDPSLPLSHTETESGMPYANADMAADPKQPVARRLAAAILQEGANIASAPGDMLNRFNAAATQPYGQYDVTSPDAAGLGLAAAGAVSIPFGGNLDASVMRSGGMGHNGGPPLDVPAAAGPVLKRGDVSNMAQLPDLRSLTVDQATEIAKRDPHLIPSADSADGAFIGGPRDIQSKRGLTNLRNGFDKYVGADTRGADWHDDARQGITDVTGGDPLQNEWMAKMHGQWSAGVSPESELGYATKENNGALTGYPVKAARPAQHQALMDAIAANDPNTLQLGDKTGEYASKINPDQAAPPNATGVNDFRYARQWGYTEPDGSPQKGALGSAQHAFLDYETANAVNRANQAGLGGRSDWTGEKIQATPWVTQKAGDILDQRPNLVKQYVKQGMSPEDAQAAGYEDAFKIANTTHANFQNKHTAYATYEDQPGADIPGHMPGSADATPAERAAYADQTSSWANAPGGRDGIYAGMQLRGGDGDMTGVAGRVQSTQPMTGMYTPPSGVPENNPGNVARPLVGIEKAPNGRILPQGDRAMLQAGETWRAGIDAQQAGAASKAFPADKSSQVNGYSYPLNRPATVQEMRDIEAAGKAHGLPDVVDTGSGITSTNFAAAGQVGPSVPLSKEAMKARDAAMSAVTPQGSPGKIPSTVDGVYAGLSDLWNEGEGSGAVTREMLRQAEQTPQMRQIFNDNPNMAQPALDRAARDENWAPQWGAPRQDIQNLRSIVGQGPGVIDRLKAALAGGKVSLPGIAGAAVVPAALRAFPSPPADGSRNGP